MSKRPVSGYHDVVKMIPLAMAEAQYSKAKCAIMAEACMTVMGMLNEHLKSRPIMCAKFTANLEKEIASKESHKSDKEFLDNMNTADYERQNKERFEPLNKTKAIGVNKDA